MDAIRSIFPLLFFALPLALAMLPGSKLKRLTRGLLGLAAMLIALMALHKYGQVLDARHVYEMRKQWEQEQHQP